MAPPDLFPPLAAFARLGIFPTGSQTTGAQTTRLDMAVQFLLSNYYPKDGSAEFPDSVTFNTVLKFVESCGSVAASRSAATTEPTARQQSTPSGTVMKESYASVLRRAVTKTAEASEGQCDKRPNLKLKKPVRFTVPLSRSSAPQIASSQDKKENCKANASISTNGKSKKRVRFDLPESFGSSTSSKSGKGCEASVDVATKFLPFLRVDQGQPTGLSPDRSNSCNASQDRQESPDFVLPWPATPINPPTAPTWHAGLSALYRHVAENVWMGDWYAPGPECNSDLGITLEQYRKYLEFQEVLGGLGLSYALSRATTKDRDLRARLRAIVGKKRRRPKVPKTKKTKAQTQTQTAQSPSKQTIRLGPPPMIKRLLFRIRDSQWRVEARLAVLLEKGLDGYRTTEKSEVQTAKDIIEEVWVDSPDGRNLYQQLQILGNEMGSLASLASQILSNLGKVRPAIDFVKQVKVKREALPASGSKTYSIRPEVLTTVSQGLARVEPAVQQFIGVCQGMRFRLERLRDIPDEFDLASLSSVDRKEDKIPEDLTGPHPDDKSPESQGPNIDDDDDDKKRTLARVEKECRRWMADRCSDIKRLCDTIEGWDEAGRQAFQILALSRQALDGGLESSTNTNSDRG